MFLLSVNKSVESTLSNNKLYDAIELSNLRLQQTMSKMDETLSTLDQFEFYTFFNDFKEQMDLYNKKLTEVFGKIKNALLAIYHEVHDKEQGSSTSTSENIIILQKILDGITTLDNSISLKLKSMFDLSKMNMIDYKKEIQQEIKEQSKEITELKNKIETLNNTIQLLITQRK